MFSRLFNQSMPSPSESSLQAHLQCYETSLDSEIISGAYEPRFGLYALGTASGYLYIVNREGNVFGSPKSVGYPLLKILPLPNSSSFFSVCSKTMYDRHTSKNKPSGHGLTGLNSVKSSKVQNIITHWIIKPEGIFSRTVEIRFDLVDVAISPIHPEFAMFLTKEGSLYGFSIESLKFTDLYVDVFENKPVSAISCQPGLKYYVAHESIDKLDVQNMEMDSEAKITVKTYDAIDQWAAVIDKDGNPHMLMFSNIVSSIDVPKGSEAVFTGMTSTSNWLTILRNETGDTCYENKKIKFGLSGEYLVPQVFVKYGKPFQRSQVEDICVITDFGRFIHMNGQTNDLFFTEPIDAKFAAEDGNELYLFTESDIYQFHDLCFQKKIKNQFGIPLAVRNGTMLVIDQITNICAVDIQTQKMTRLDTLPILNTRIMKDKIDFICQEGKIVTCYIATLEDEDEEDEEEEEEEDRKEEKEKEKKKKEEKQKNKKDKHRRKHKKEHHHKKDKKEKHQKGKKTKNDDDEIEKANENVSKEEKEAKVDEKTETSEKVDGKTETSENLEKSDTSEKTETNEKTENCEKGETEEKVEPSPTEENKEKTENSEKNEESVEEKEEKPKRRLSESFEVPKPKLEDFKFELRASEDSWPIENVKDWRYYEGNLLVLTNENRFIYDRKEKKAGKPEDRILLFEIVTDQGKISKSGNGFVLIVKTNKINVYVNDKKDNLHKIRKIKFDSTPILGTSITYWGTLLIHTSDSVSMLTLPDPTYNPIDKISLSKNGKAVIIPHTGAVVFEPNSVKIYLDWISKPDMFDINVPMIEVPQVNTIMKLFGKKEDTLKDVDQTFKYQRARSAAANLQETTDIMQKILVDAQERGERLNEMEIKAEQLLSSAQKFHELAKSLRKSPFF